MVVITRLYIHDGIFSCKKSDNFCYIPGLPYRYYMAILQVSETKSSVSKVILKSYPGTRCGLQHHQFSGYKRSRENVNCQIYFAMNIVMSFRQCIELFRETTSIYSVVESRWQRKVARGENFKLGFKSAKVVDIQFVPYFNE